METAIRWGGGGRHSLTEHRGQRAGPWTFRICAGGWPETERRWRRTWSRVCCPWSSCPPLPAKACSWPMSWGRGTRDSECETGEGGQRGEDHRWRRERDTHFSTNLVPGYKKNTHTHTNTHPIDVHIFHYPFCLHLTPECTVYKFCKLNMGMKWKQVFK